MPRHRQKCPCQRYTQSVLEYILNVLQCRKSQRNEDCVDHTVEHIVEIRIIPCRTVEEEEFASFFDQTDRQGQNDIVLRIVIIGKVRQNEVLYCNLQHDSRYDRDTAHQDHLGKQ